MPTEEHDIPLLYCLQDYARVQQYTHYNRFFTEKSVFCFDIRDATAISLPGSPSGGSMSLSGDQNDFLGDLHAAETALSRQGVQKIEWIQSPFYYPGHIPADWLQKAGFKQLTQEVSHFLDLQQPPVLHAMEQRKLAKSGALSLEEVSVDHLTEIHQFIAECRAAQGIQINISAEKLRNSFEVFPNQYRIFTASERELVAAVIMVEPTDAIAYYFLPATHLSAKKTSPMVALLQFIQNHYQHRGFRYIDLGISSQNGNPQTGLISFKERMGGIRTERNTWAKYLD